MFTFIHNEAVRNTDNLINSQLRISLEQCKVLNDDGRLNKQSLLEAFGNLTGNELLILHVTKQNAGVLIWRSSE